MARKTKEDAEKTKEILLISAETLFLEQGVAATSLDDIARHAGLTRGAVYWHFENKQALFDAMHKRVCLPFEQDFQQVVEADNTLQALYAHCLYVMEHITHDCRMRNIVTILLLKCEETDRNQSHSERIRHEREEIITHFTHAFERAKQSGHLPDHVNASVAATALHALIHGMIYDSISSKNPVGLLPMVAPMLDIFFNGIQASNNNNQPCDH